MSADVHGILLVDKPSGWTSHDVVAKARRLCSQRKIGHTGTLDPMATGLLVLCLGDATRLVEYMVGHDKRYEGEIVLGARTDTDDAEGTVVDIHPVPALDAARLLHLEDEFTGHLMQRPPAYSAVKVAGERAYAAARRGNEIDLQQRQVTVYGLRLRPVGEQRLRIDVACGSGTYVRSLARDIGEVIGCGAHLGALRRTHAGGFAVDEAITLDELASIAAAGRLADVLRMPDEGVIENAAAIVGQANAARFLHGMRFKTTFSGPPVSEPVRIYDDDGTFLGVAGISQEGAIRVLKVLSSRQIS